MRKYIKVDFDLPYELIPKWVKDIKIAITYHVLARFGVVVEGVKFSKSKKGNTHLTAFYDDSKAQITDLDKCWIQWLIGDDCGRTYYNLKRIEKGCKNWNILDRKG